MSARARRRGAGGRSAKRALREHPVAEAAAFIERKIPYYDLLDDESLSLIEENADTVLQEIGIEFRDFPDALALFKDAGADVDGERVRFQRNNLGLFQLDIGTTEDLDVNGQGGDDLIAGSVGCVT